MNRKELPRVVILLGLATVVAPGLQTLQPKPLSAEVHDHARPCSLMDWKDGAECQRTDFRLTCRHGIATEYTRGSNYEITELLVVEWPGDCFNVGRLWLRFPELRHLQLLNCTRLKTFKGRFDRNSKVEKITMRGLASLHRVPSDMVAEMLELQQLDLRSNGLRHMDARLLRAPANLQQVYLGDNKWDCSDGGLDWLAMERENGTVRTKIADYHLLMCHQQLYRGKPLHKVMDIIRTVRQTCPAPCTCAMTHVVSDRAGGIIPLITVNCSALGLSEPPETLPPSTTTLRLEGNKILSIRSIIQNSHYRKLKDLYLDNNSLASVKELDGSDWFTTFRVLSLRGNMLRQIPVYVFDKAMQGNNDIMHVYLGDNPWRCDCHFVPRFQNLLLKYKRVIADLPDIRCSKSDDKTISLARISTLPLGDVCKKEGEPAISRTNIANIVLSIMIILVLGRFLYDWHNFKTTGKLPLFSRIMP